MCAPQVTRHTSMWYSSSCHALVNMGAFCLRRHPVSVHRLYHPRTVLSVGGPFAYFARNARCTVTTDLLACDIPTHKTTSPPERPFSHYIHSHRLAAEVWTTMKNNFLGRKNLGCSFYLYRFRKYESYGFPTINFCNPGAHYETPYIYVRSR